MPTSLFNRISPHPALNGLLHQFLSCSIHDSQHEGNQRRCKSTLLSPFAKAYFAQSEKNEIFSSNFSGSAMQSFAVLH
jgi:hypothetical protein